MQNDKAKIKKEFKKQCGECCGGNKEELHKSEQAHLHSLGISEAKGDLAAMARDYDNLGLVYLNLHEHDKAEQMYNKALDINRKLDSRERIARNYAGLGSLFLDQGQYDKAEDMFLSAIKIYKESDDEYELQAMYFNLGVTYKIKREFNKAEESLKKSLDINERIERPDRIFIEAVGYLELGKIYGERSDKEKEREYLQKAVELFKSIGATNVAERVRGRIDKL